MQSPLLLERDRLDDLIHSLIQAGYEVVGPTLGEGAIVYGPVRSSREFPVGWTEKQEGGTYRLKKRSDSAVFGFTVGPHTWKKYLFPPQRRLWAGKTDGTDFDIQEEPSDSQPRAFFGVRSCELQAIALQDRIFIQDQFVNADYQQRRAHSLIISVQCGEAAPTCFCDSMQTGPRAENGFDLALTEILEEQRHYFVVEVGSPQGESIVQKLNLGKAEAVHEERAHAQTDRAKGQMGRTLNTRGIKPLLYENQEHPRWDQVAKDCLTCANCTMVCPTCFCSTVEDITDVTGNHTERWQRWDSCFTLDFTNVHGGSVRSSNKSRYRQWMTHKLASWIDQFDSSGCVGCGRCITWCPVGIDITQEVKFLRGEEPLPQTNSSEGEASHENP